ncbi:MAG: hypothetical protein ACYDCL_07425 [Myxococcales bacterium]
MRRLLGMAACAALLACLPGKGENQSCVQTPDCQSRMICLGADCLGSEVSDAGQICKFECTASSDCPNAEVCVGGPGNCARCESSQATDAG